MEEIEIVKLIEKLKFGLKICKVTRSELVHINDEDAEKLLDILEERRMQIAESQRKA